MSDANGFNWNLVTDFDRYQAYEECDCLVIRDTENDAAWIRSTVAIGLEGR